MAKTKTMRYKWGQYNTLLLVREKYITGRIYISKYFFIILLIQIIAFLFIKINKSVEGLTIFNRNIINTAYVDGITFF